MTTFILNKFKIDLTPFKIFFSLMVIYLACTASVSATLPVTQLFEPNVESMLTSDLKSCPVPYSNDYCRIEDLDNCEAKNFWPQVLNNYSRLNKTARSMCTDSPRTHNQNSES